MNGPTHGGGRGWHPMDGRGGGGRPQHARKMPPAESTGAEAAYLHRNKEARTQMVVRLLDGEVVRGVIEYYDRDMIKINRTDGPNVFIRKRHIRYIYKDPTAPAPQTS